jgi:hypothetical protein
MAYCQYPKCPALFDTPKINAPWVVLLTQENITYSCQPMPCGAITNNMLVSDFVNCALYSTMYYE